jgi:hypothetical protein
VLTALASSNRKLALDDAMFARSNELIARALRGGNQLTRQELKAVLERAGIHTDVQRLAHLVMRAELDALICSGPRRGQQFTYALLEERVPKAKNLSRDEALAALTLRYFLSHGPAQLTDFTWWSGLTMNDAKAGIEMVRSELVEETLHDLSYWSSPPKRVTARKGPRAFLLSLYDEFTIAYKDRSALGEGRYTERLLARGNALTSVLLLDGQIAGTWRRVLKGGRVEITVKPFMRLGRGGKEVIAAEAHRYGKFLEMPVTVSLAR